MSDDEIITVLQKTQGPSPNTEALECLETRKRRSPFRSHTPSDPVLAPLSSTVKRERGKTGFYCCCNVRLIGYVAGSSIETAEGDGIPSPSLGFSLRAKRRFCAVADGGRPRALI